MESYCMFIDYSNIKMSIKLKYVQFLFQNIKHNLELSLIEEVWP